jgi:hypothetical protein
MHEPCTAVGDAECCRRGADQDNRNLSHTSAVDGDRRCRLLSLSRITEIPSGSSAGIAGCSCAVPHFAGRRWTPQPTAWYLVGLSQYHAVRTSMDPLSVFILSDTSGRSGNFNLISWSKLRSDPCICQPQHCPCSDLGQPCSSSIRLDLITAEHWQIA